MAISHQTPVPPTVFFFFFFLALAIALLVSSLAAPHAVNLAGPGHTELGKLGSLEARLTSWGP